MMNAKTKAVTFFLSRAAATTTITFRAADGCDGGKAPSFQGMKPPPGYVAGEGGARRHGSPPAPTSARVRPRPPWARRRRSGTPSRGLARRWRDDGRGRGAPQKGAAPVDDEPDQQPAQFDEFQGGDAGIFAARKGEYDDDDREADAIWASVVDHMRLAPARRARGSAEGGAREVPQR